MPLCRLLETLGAATTRLPAITIRPLPAHGGQEPLIDVAPGYDLIVFVSANAVRFGVRLLGQRRDLTLAAVGPATLRALNQAGFRVAITPGGGFDTEALLAHPRLLQPAGQRVLIIKGEGGRELLETELARRGAVVTTASVYARQRATLDPPRAAALLEQFAAGALQVVTATSVEIGLSLLAMGAAHPPLLDCLQRSHWLLPGGRVAAALQAAGLLAPLLPAASAEDQALVDALLRWRASASGA